MVNKIKSILLSLSSLIVLAVIGGAPALAATAATADCTSTNKAVNSQSINQCLCTGSNIGSSSNCSDTQSSISTLIATVINVLSLIVGAVAVVMIIVGGFRYITSAGNPEGAKGARNTIVYAVVGLVIVAVAQIIVHFVINSTTSATSGS